MIDKKNNSRILALLFIGVLMGALDISIVGPAIPAIEKSINVDKQLMSWIFSIYVLANLVGISLMARLSDLYGRRKIYMLSLSIFAIGSFIVALSHDFNILLAGRAVQGFGASGIFPVASAVVGDIYPPEKRGRALGLIGAVFGIAFILGPIISGLVLKFFVWNDLFYINIPIAFVLIYLSNKLLPSVSVSSVTSIDKKGIVLLGLLLSSFAFGINRINAKSFIDSLISLKVLPFLIFAFAAFIVLIFVEKETLKPVVDPRAIASFGVPTSTASFMLLPVVIATAIGSPISGRLLDEHGSRALIIAGLILASIGFVFFSTVTTDKLIFYSGGAFLGLGFSVLSGSALRYIMLNEVSVVERATTQGLITIFVSIGQMTGASIIGTIVASNSEAIKGYKQAFLFISIFASLLAASGLFLKSRSRELQSITNPDK